MEVARMLKPSRTKGMSYCETQQIYETIRFGTKKSSRKRIEVLNTLSHHPTVIFTFQQTLEPLEGT